MANLFRVVTESDWITEMLKADEKQWLVFAISRPIQAKFKVESAIT